MKHIIIPVSIFFILSITACKKSSTADNTFTGKWKLIQTLADPGDGSGRWQPVPAETHGFIQFNTDSSVQSNTYPGVIKYSIRDSIRVEFTWSGGNAMLFRYRFSGSSLEINPPCIEPCGERFIKD